jgi:nitrate reductase NapAB chaperone NapD
LEVWFEEFDGGNNQLVVSSILVHAERGEFETVAGHIQNITEAEIVETRQSKLAVVLQTESTADAVRITSELRSFPGINGVEMVSHFFEDEVLGKDGPDGQADNS